MHFIKKLKIIRYFAVGGIAAVVNLSIFFIFAKLLEYNYLTVGAPAFLVATFVNYKLSILYVFESGARFEKKQELIWVYIVSAMGLGIDLTALYICVDIFVIELMISKILATGVVFFWNYYARKHFVFNQG